MDSTNVVSMLASRFRASHPLCLFRRTFERQFTQMYIIDFCRARLAPWRLHTSESTKRSAPGPCDLSDNWKSFFSEVNRSIKVIFCGLAQCKHPWSKPMVWLSMWAPWHRLRPSAWHLAFGRGRQVVRCEQNHTSICGTSLLWNIRWWTVLICLSSASSRCLPGPKIVRICPHPSLPIYSSYTAR